MKSQDLLGLSVAIGITAIAVGLAFAGTAIQNNVAPTNEEIPELIKNNPNLIVGNFGGITDSKESIKIVFNPSDQINLDTDDGFVRAKITYEGYQPQYGRVYLTVIPVNDPSNSYKSELLLSLRGDAYETEINHHLDKATFVADPSKLGQYVVRISTENGKTGAQAAYSVNMPSIQNEPEIVQVVKEEKGQGGIIASNSLGGLDMNALESGLENTVLKKYLGELLEEYYDGKLSVDQVDQLAKYDQISCDFVNKGNSLKLECEINTEK